MYRFYRWYTSPSRFCSRVCQRRFTTNSVFFTAHPCGKKEKFPAIDEEKVQAAKERLSVAMENAPTGIDVKVEILSGKPTDTIPRILKQYPIEVILTGTPIRSPIKRKVCGQY